jgi:integrase
MTRSYFGSIQYLGKDRYRISCEGKRKADGSRYRPSEVVRGTRHDAEMALAKMALDSGHAPGTFDDWVFSDYWDAVYEPTLENVGKDTARGIKGAYKRNLAPLFGDLEMHSITKRLIEQKLSGIPNEHARWAAFKAMRQAFNYGWENELLSDNPFLRKPKVKAPRKTEQETLDAKGLSEWMDGIRGYRYEAALLCMAAYGLRREEACALRWNDIVFEDGCCIARINKTVTDDGQSETKTERSTRTVVCAGRPAKRLEELSGDGWLCASVVDGSLVKPHWVYASYKKWCKDKGVRYIAPRNLRTTYATVQQANGVDSPIVSRALGHTKLSTDYAHYFMANKPAQIAAAKSLASALDYTRNG